MKLEIGIAEKNLEKCVALLSIILSDEMTLYVKLRNFIGMFMGKVLWNYINCFNLSIQS
jgi:hypothetical protein